MTPTNKLRFVGRKVHLGPFYRTVDPDGKMQEGAHTIRVLQQWWEPEYQEINAGKTGEWRDVPLEEEE